MSASTRTIRINAENADLDLEVMKAVVEAIDRFHLGLEAEGFGDQIGVVGLTLEDDAINYRVRISVPEYGEFCIYAKYDITENKLEMRNEGRSSEYPAEEYGEVRFVDDRLLADQLTEGLFYAANIALGVRMGRFQKNLELLGTLRAGVRKGPLSVAPVILPAEIAPLIRSVVGEDTSMPVDPNRPRRSKPGS